MEYIFWKIDILLKNISLY